MTNTKQSTEKILKNYIQGIDQLDQVLGDATDSQLDLARAPGKWTIRQIVHHIADAEDIWKMAIKAALSNPGCTFDISWYILNNKCAVPLKYADRPIEEAISLFKAARRQIVELMHHVNQSWKKSMILAHTDEKKEYSMTDMINWQIQHLQIHVDQILETRKVHGI